MEYAIVHGRTSTELERAVTMHISLGYKPIGGIAVKFFWRPQGDNIEQFYQAMIKD